MKSIPSELFLLHQWFVVEESLSVIRHDVRNRLAAIRNANFYVRRRLPKVAPDAGTADPRVPEFLALIATEADVAEKILESRLPAPEHGEVVAASSLVNRARELISVPPTVHVTVEAASDARVRVAPDEAVLALWCLIENAVDALEGSDGSIRLRVAEREQQVALEVEDDANGKLPERALEPYFTTRTGRMGIGLNIAKRIAARWRGTFAIAPLSRGTCATLTFAMES